MSQEVAILDKAARQFARSPSRPTSRVVPARQAESDDVRRAKARVRAAAWRAQQDAAKRPEAGVIAMSLLKALLTSSKSDLDPASTHVFGKALQDLQAAGYSLSETKAVCRRLKDRFDQKDSSDFGNSG